MTETIVEPSQTDVNPSQSLGSSHPSLKPWHFDVESAKRAAQRSVESRKAKQAEADQAKAIVAQLKVAAVVEPEDSYRLERLRITREQLSGLDKDLKAAEDEKGKKAICDAIARLSEVERQLAGRPAPGSLRPAQAKTKRTTPDSYGPVE